MISLVIVAASAARADAGTPQTIGVVNVAPADIDSVAKVAGTLGYQLNASPPDAATHPEKIVFLEVTAPTKARAALSADAAQHWMDYVQPGGRLLVSFDQHGAPDLVRLAPMLPTIGWRTGQDVLGPNHLTESDASFFPDPKAVLGMTVPFFFPIRPWLAVERGQARYDRFDRPMIRVDEKSVVIPAGTEWWTRPLINREWTVRASGADVAASPFLLTGRYGAGRVAVFASSLKTATGPQADAFWTQVIQWLGKDEPAPPATAPSSPLSVTVSGERATQPPGGAVKDTIALAAGTGLHATVPALNTVSPGNLVVSIQNPNPQPIKVKIVARFLSWEHAMVEDRVTDATLAASGPTLVKLPLPVPSAISYQEIEARPAFDVRLGVLSENGGLLFNETKTTVDVSPPVSLAVTTEELRTIPFPFPLAARPDKRMGGRQGMPVYSCAYLPGSTVQATISASNGVRNIASLAAISNVEEPDNKSTTALITGAIGEHKPDWFLPTTSDYFHTDKGSTVTFKLTFPQPVTVTGVVLYGAIDNYRNSARTMPTQAVITQSGKELAREATLADRFKAETGRVLLPFAPVKLQELTVALTKPTANGPNNEMTLGQIEVQGTTEAAPAPVKGQVALLLTNSLTGDVTRVHTEDIALGPLEQKKITVPVPLPAATDAQFYRLDAVLLGAGEGPRTTSGFTLMTVSGKETMLQSLDSLEDMDFDSIYPKGASMGFIVTRGFRNVFDNAVGTAEMGEGWGQPDDLVWAYAHGFKQEGRTVMQANKLFVTSTDMRHYSTPWRQFYNGEEFYDVATPLIVNRMKELKPWSKSDSVLLGHSDRWDTGPSIGANHTWQDFEGFNAWLIAQKLPGLQGRTLTDLIAEIAVAPRASQWYEWQMQRYVANMRNLRDSFAKEGKKLLLTAQGVSVMPFSQAKEIDQVIRGNSDDCTWGEAASDMLYTTGRQMGNVALNPTMDMSTLNEWQWLSGILGNAQWRGAVGTTEPARRHQYERAFRGVLRPDGGYGSMSFYGYNTNGGVSFTMNELDYNQWEQTMIKESLLVPTAPIGAGVIISNARYEKPENALFDCGDGGLFPEAHLIQDSVQRLGYAGVAVSFSGNAALLDGWKNNAPLVLLNLQDFSEAEQNTVAQMVAAGRPLGVFQEQGTAPLPAGLAALFGVTTTGGIADGKEVGKIQERSVVAKGNCLYVPAQFGTMSQEETDALAPLLRKALAQVITLPTGTAGYGFVSNGRNFAVVEDWREESRVADLRVKANPKATALLAVDTNDNRPLQATKDGDDWLIHLPLRPGDAALVAYKETMP